MSGDGNRGSNDRDVSGAEAVATGGTTYSERKIKETKKKQFTESGAKDISRKTQVGTIGVASQALQAGSIKTRTFFDEKVLSSKRSKQNIGYTQQEFRNLSLTRQNEIYSSYMDRRLSGEIDAYGNPKGGRYEDIPVSKDGKVIRYEKKFISEDREPVKTVKQIEEENKKIEQEEIASKEISPKKPKGIRFGRSLFGRAGGRGYFD